MSKNFKKIIYRFIGLFIFLVVAYLLIALINTYYPFVKARLAFTVEHSNKTTISNKDFGVQFAVGNNCQIDSEILNYLYGHYSWSGHLDCGQENNQFSLLVTDFQPELYQDMGKINNNEHWLTWLVQDKWWNVGIIDSNKEKILVISGYKNTENIRDEILDSLQDLNN